MSKQQDTTEAADGQSSLTDGLGVQVGTTAAAVHGWEQIGSVGDLRIRYLAALRQGGLTRVWVLGCFDSPNHPLAQPDERSNRSELFALVWQLVRSDVLASLAQAKVFLRAQFHRMSQPFRRQGQLNILERAYETPNGKGEQPAANETNEG